MQLEMRPLGVTGLNVTSLAFGTSPLSDMVEAYGYASGAERAIAAVNRIFDGPVNFLDTSNNYGVGGLAEQRIGAVVRSRGLPEGFVIQTKVDPDPETRDFSGARVRRSFEESLERLGVDRVPLLALHDPEFMRPDQDGFARDGALRALVALRDEGRVDHLAVASGSISTTRRYLDSGEFSVVLNHNRYTLLDRSAEALFEFARERGIAVLNAAPYGGGMLVKGPEAQPRYAYGHAPALVHDAAVRMAEVCASAGVPLAAAALQFSVGAPLVDVTVVGVSAPERIEETLRLLEYPLPDGLLEELLSLAPPRSSWLGEE